MSGKIKDEKELDMMLKFICEHESININEIKGMNNPKNICKRLQSFGFITTRDLTLISGECQFVYPTDKGKDFYRNGGFKVERRKNIAKNIIAWVTLILAAIAAIASVIGVI